MPGKARIRRQKQWYDMILLLAVRTGWSRRAIMALPDAEAAYYVETLIKMSNPEDTDV